MFTMNTERKAASVSFVPASGFDRFLPVTFECYGFHCGINVCSFLGILRRQQFGTKCGSGEPVLQLQSLEGG